MTTYEPTTSTLSRRPWITYLLDGLGGALVVLGILGGLILAVQTDGPYYDNSHPYVWSGVTVMVVSVFVAAVMWGLSVVISLLANIADKP